MFNVTQAAAQELVSASLRSDAQGMALRVAARQAADGSIEFGMGFDDERQDDEPAQFGELTVLIGSPSKPLLEGTVLDYVEVAPGRFDFIFVPPQPAGLAGDEPSAAAGADCGGGSCRSCGG